MARILVIEDEENLRLTIEERLQRGGYHVRGAQCLKDANDLLDEFDFDVILTDVCLGSENGIDFVKQLREDGYDGVAVVITAFGTVNNAVSAMKNGADDFLQKPLALKELPVQVQRWLEQRRLARRLELYERQERARAESQELIGTSESWKRAIATADRLASVPVADGEHGSQTGLPAILLLGETGSGKGLLARHIHKVASQRAGESPRSEPPFVQINCAALPAALVEAELFGHEKGAFTDARQAKIGLFEIADGGTIFLDEVGEMPTELQAKLLLAVEQGRFRRVGGSKERCVRARIIAATNQDLAQRVESGEFRGDLFYRLNTFTIRIPPLRERGEDAGLIADSMLRTISREFGRPTLRFSPAAKNAIKRHHWPGNVRELVNCVQRAVMLCEGSSIEASDLALGEAGVPAITAVEPGELVFDFDRATYTVDTVERSLLMQALDYTRGNITKAAKLLGMQRSSLRYRIERLDLAEHVKELTGK